MTLHMYFRLMAAIFDFPIALTSDNIHNNFTMLLDPENVPSSRWNLVASLYTSYDIRHCICTSS